jgi:hypothetical protein
MLLKFVVLHQTENVAPMSEMIKVTLITVKALAMFALFKAVIWQSTALEAILSVDAELALAPISLPFNGLIASINAFQLCAQITRT